MRTITQPHAGGSNVFTFQAEHLAGGRVIRFTARLGASAVSFAEALRLWQEDEDFRSRFMGLLAESPFSALRWETPPVTAKTSGRPFEFVLLDSPGLAGNPDGSAFPEHLDGAADELVIAFPNLGKDAILVVPSLQGSPSAYGHLAAFVRQAPEKQKHDLWKMVGATMARRLGGKPVWLNTAGAGVPWLHVRLDDRPKYYGYAPYRKAGPATQSSP